MKTLKIGLLVGGLLVGIFFVYAVFSLRHASSRQETLDGEWRQMTGVSPEELIAAYPKTEKNVSARELERLATKLEIGETCDGDGARIARDYFTERGTEAGDAAEKLPEDIKGFLTIHRSDLDALYSFVRQNSRPEWATDAGQREFMPSPNLAFHNRLHEIIALDVLNQTEKNQNRQALEAFEASRKASEFFRERPEVAFHIINLLVTSAQNHALRKMNDLPPEQIEQPETSDYRRLAVKVLEHEYAATSLSIESEKSATLPKLIDKLFPFSRFNAALDTSGVVREIVAEWQQRDLCASLNLTGDARLAWWNRDGRIVFPSALQIWRNFAAMSYDAELTERVLRLKQFRRAAPQADMPPELSKMSSALCGDAIWTAEKQMDGSLVIRLNRAADLIKDEETPLTYKIDARK